MTDRTQVPGVPVVGGGMATLLGTPVVATVVAGPTGAEGGEVTSSGSMVRLFLSVFAENRLALVGAATIVAIVLFCFLGPVLYHTDQVHTNLLTANLPPGGAHPLGTDNVGYDVLGRLMVGGQVALEVGLGAALLSSLLGAAWGAVAGFFGRWIDSVMMRVVDSVYAIPPLLLMLLMVTIFSPTTLMFIIVVAVVSWLPTARLVRGESLSVRTREYIEAARGAGVTSTKVIVRHIIPNVMGTIVVQTTLQVANAILLLAGVSFLGLGTPPPSTSWGAMLNNGLNFIYDGYWWLIYPAGVAIVLTVLAFNFVGDALRDALDVRLQRH
ncbi:MAG TPA: ABC transporter permease [Acidimicrobiales bacterium]|nr:ABC transporter permease [Acidimicrobiales bacterium]